MSKKAKQSLVMILSAVIISACCIAFLFNSDNNIGKIELIRRNVSAISQIELAPAEKYTQSVYIYKDFSDIEIGRADTTQTGSIKVEIKFEGSVVYSEEVLFDEEEQTKVLGFAAKGGTYGLTLENTGKNSITFPLVSNSSYDVEYDRASTVPILKLGVSVRTNRVQILFLGCVALLLLLSVSAMVFWLQGKMFTRRMIIAWLSIIGVVYTLVFPAWNVNDFNEHFLTAYHYSNKLLGVKDENDTILVRKDDNYYCRYVFLDKYQYYYSPAKRSCDDAVDLFSAGVLSDEMEPITESYLVRGYKVLGYRYWNYIPFIIGITVARLLSLNIIVALIISRLLSLCMILLGIRLALSRLPKSLELPISFVFCLPVVAMCLTAVSYDALTFVVVLNFIAFVYSIRQKYKTRNAIGLIAFSYLLCAMKGGAYVLFALLLLLIPFRRGKKEKWLVAYSVAAMIAALLIIYRGVVFKGGTTYQFGSSGREYYSVGWAIKNPLDYLVLMGRTYLRQPDLLYSVIGRNLGWNAEVLPYLVCGMYGLLLFLSVLRNENMEGTVLSAGKTEKRTMIVIIVLSLLFTPAMLLSNTRISSDTIVGLQGRYFIPLIFIGIILFVNKQKELRNKRIDSFILLTGMVILQSFSLYHMSITFLLR